MTRTRRGSLLAPLVAWVVALPLLAGCGASERTVPDLVGQRLDRAYAALAEAGFESIDAKDSVGDDSVFVRKNWAVVTQNPAPGARVSTEEVVQLGIGPLDDVRTLQAFSAPLSPEVDTALQEARAQAEDMAAAEAAERAAEPVEPEDVGLPVAYAPDHGEDAYERLRPRVLRRDLAEYLLAVREVAPETADHLAPALRVVPATWCSLWLPRHTPAELDTWVVEADASALLTAQALGVGYTPSTTPAVTAVMAAAREEAGRLFCPEQAARPGERVTAKPQGAGAFPGERAPVPMTETVLDGWWFHNSWTGHDVTMRADTLRIAYLHLLGQPAQELPSRGWPVEMDCDFYDQVLSGELQRNTIGHVLAHSQVFDVAEREDIASNQARHHFDALVGGEVAGC